MLLPLQQRRRRRRPKQWQSNVTYDDKQPLCARMCVSLSAIDLHSFRSFNESAKCLEIDWQTKYSPNGKSTNKVLINVYRNAISYRLNWKSIIKIENEKGKKNKQFLLRLNRFAVRRDMIFEYADDDNRNASQAPERSTLSCVKELIRSSNWSAANHNHSTSFDHSFDGQQKIEIQDSKRFDEMFGKNENCTIIFISFNHCNKMWCSLAARANCHFGRFSRESFKFPCHSISLVNFLFCFCLPIVAFPRVLKFSFDKIRISFGRAKFAIACAALVLFSSSTIEF